MSRLRSACFRDLGAALAPGDTGSLVDLGAACRTELTRRAAHQLEFSMTAGNVIRTWEGYPTAAYAPTVGSLMSTSDDYMRSVYGSHVDSFVATPEACMSSVYALRHRVLEPPAMPWVDGGLIADWLQQEFITRHIAQPTPFRRFAESLTTFRDEAGPKHSLFASDWTTQLTSALFPPAEPQLTLPGLGDVEFESPSAVLEQLPVLTTREIRLLLNQIIEEIRQGSKYFSATSVICRLRRSLLTLARDLATPRRVPRSSVGAGNRTHERVLTHAIQVGNPPPSCGSVRRFREFARLADDMQMVETGNGTIGKSSSATSVRIGTRAGHSRARSASSFEQDSLSGGGARAPRRDFSWRRPPQIGTGPPWNRRTWKMVRDPRLGARHWRAGDPTRTPVVA